MLHSHHCVLYRKISRGRLVAVRDFTVISLAETIRSWWSNPKIAELLRYGYEFKEQEMQYDVQDGDLWKEFIARGMHRYVYIDVSLLLF